MSWAELIETGRAALRGRRATNGAASAAAHWESLKRAVDFVVDGRVPNPLGGPPAGWGADVREVTVTLAVDPADLGRRLWRVTFRMAFGHAVGWRQVPTEVAGVRSPFAVPIKTPRQGELVDAPVDYWWTADTLPEAAALAVEAMEMAEVARRECERVRGEQRLLGVLS